MQWLKHVDAPRLLKVVFGELTEHRQEFRKTRDTIEILKVINQIDPDHISELKEHVALIIKTALRDTPP
ncbi:hypothetical protein [Parasphingorhabdus sp.]|uniref:hypothetical protein n=1 Tax=Parasphingorhabdus sp. TaxID=2709688 RepID=UPI0030024DA2